MEEDNTQYFCDEWNNMKPSDFVEKYHKIIDMEGNPRDIVLRNHEKDFINNYRQLECRCDVPKPNNYTGNCINCNLIIKPIR